MTIRMRAVAALLPLLMLFGGCRQYVDISPDGKSVVYVSMGRQGRNYAILQMDIDGQNIRPLANLPKHEYYGPTYAPDGKSVAYIALNTDRDAVRVGGHVGLYVTDLATGQSRKLVSIFGRTSGNYLNGRGDDNFLYLYYSWSPDSNYIYYTDSQELMQAETKSVAVNLPISRVQVTGRISVSQVVPEGYNFFPQVSPDGQRLAYLRAPAPRPDAPGATLIIQSLEDGRTLEVDFAQIDGYNGVWGPVSFCTDSSDMIVTILNKDRKKGPSHRTLRIDQSGLVRDLIFASKSTLAVVENPQFPKQYLGGFKSNNERNDFVVYYQDEADRIRQSHTRFMAPVWAADGLSYWVRDNNKKGISQISKADGHTIRTVYDLDRYLEEANEYYQDGLYSEAVTAYSMLLWDDLYSDTALSGVLLIFKDKLADHQAAAKWGERYLRRLGKLPELYKLYTRAGLFEQAKKLYAAELRVNPQKMSKEQAKIAIFNRLLLRYAGTDPAALALVAQERYQAVLTDYPQSDLAAHAAWTMIQIAYSQKASQPKKMIARIEAFRTDYPQAEQVGQLMYMQASLHLEADQPGQAERVLKELVENYPENSYWDRAQSKLKKLTKQQRGFWRRLFGG